MIQRIWKSLDRLYPVLGFIILVILYLAFRIKIHTWESYMYSLSVDGFFDLRYQYSLMNAHSFSLSSSINWYHPNHPLLYALIYGIKLILAGFYVYPNSLFIAQGINLFMGLTTAIFCYGIVKELSSSRFFAILIATMIALSDIIWYQSNSGEVYSAALCFIVSGFFFTIHLYRIQEKRRKLYFVILGGCVSGIAVSFHLLAIFFIPVCLYLLLAIKQRSGMITWRLIFLWCGICSGIIFITYGILFIIFLQADSFSTYKNLLFLYSDTLGFWNVTSGDYISLIVQMLKSLWKGYQNLIQAIIPCSRSAGIGISIIPEFIGIIGLICFSIVKKNIFQKALLIWFFIYYVLICIILRIPSVHDYWSFIVVPFMLICAFAFHSCLKAGAWRVILVVFPMFFLITNLRDDIYPKAIVSNREFFTFASHANVLEKQIPVVMILNYYMFSELWYLRTYNPGIRIFYLHDYCNYTLPNFEHDFQELMNRMRKDSGEFLLVTEEASFSRITDFIGENSTGKRIFNSFIKRDIRLIKFSVEDFTMPFSAIYQNISVYRYRFMDRL